VCHLKIKLRREFALMRGRRAAAFGRRTLSRCWHINPGDELFKGGFPCAGTILASAGARCGRTSRWRPSSVCRHWLASKAATSASTACTSSARAPLRRISVSGSLKVPCRRTRERRAIGFCQYDRGAECVILAAAICFLGSVVVISLFNRAQKTRGRTRLIWLGLSRSRSFQGYQ
jgi:hypothetical protein